MLSKIVIVFLLAMLLVGMIGKAFGARLRGRPPSQRVEKPVICGHCGRFIIGKGGCDCRQRKG